MSRLIVCVLLVVLALIAVPAGMERQAVAYPQPALATRAWQLEFTYSEPRAIAVKDLAGEQRWYWYMPYKVVNHTGAEQLYIPEITVASDEGHILVAGKGVPVGVFDAIKTALRNNLLLSPVEVTGQILQGGDYVKESVAVWPDFDKPVSRVSIFFNGLSGETARIPVPDLENPGTTREVLVSKQLMVEYAFLSRPKTPQGQTIEKVRERWIMR